MDVTPELLEEFDFRKKGRGYDPEQVDELLSRAAATLADVTTRLEEQRARAEEAEATAAEATARSRTDTESDETIQRTLLLAQRTADAAVQEAEEAAGRKMADATEESRRLIAEAEAARSESLAAAEDEVRTTVAATRERLMQEIEALESIRGALMGDVEGLETHLEHERDGLKASIEALGELLSRSERLGHVDLPELSDPPPPPAPEPSTAEPPATDTPAAEWQADEVAPAASAAVLDTRPAADGGDTDEPSDEVVEAVLKPADEEAGDDFAAAWHEGEEGQTDQAGAPPPPPPPPPQPDPVDATAQAVPDEAPPPPPPPPGFDPAAPVPEDEGERPATLDEAIGSPGFGGLDGDTLAAEAEQDDDDDNAWLAELDEENTRRGGRRRFGRRD